jgi:hypothetical protein
VVRAALDFVGCATDGRKKVTRSLCPITTVTEPLKRMLSPGAGELVPIYVSRKLLILLDSKASCTVVWYRKEG